MKVPCCADVKCPKCKHKCKMYVYLIIGCWNVLARLESNYMLLFLTIWRDNIYSILRHILLLFLVSMCSRQQITTSPHQITTSPHQITTSQHQALQSKAREPRRGAGAWDWTRAMGTLIRTSNGKGSPQRIALLHRAHGGTRTMEGLGLWRD